MNTLLYFARQIFMPVFFMFTLVACSDEPALLSRIDNDAVILAFGDSLTEGYNSKKDQAYPAILEAMSGRRVINAGVTGEVSEFGLRRLPDLLEKYKPALVILCHGGNDILRKKSLTKMEANLRQMMRLIKSSGAEVVLLGVPKPGLFLSSHEVYEKLAAENEVVFISDLIPDILGDNNLKSDTVHPNSKGYRVMAETIYDVLKQQGAL